MKKKIYLISPRGFCAGVTRAIDIVDIALKKYGKPVYVKHEIVHNKFVIDELKSKGAIFVEDIKDVPKGMPLIFSAHGVSKVVISEALEKQAKTIDATCPLVTKVHVQAAKFDLLGYHIILIGHRNHPEVIGTMGQVKSLIYLIEKEEDLKLLPFSQNQKIAYVTQTTLSVDDTFSIITAIKKKFKRIVEPRKKDICYATTNRQDAVKKIAAKCDIFVVIGAHNSSNSLRLVEVAELYGAKKSILLENIEQFDDNLLSNVKNIGLTASASAPEILVHNFIEILKKKYAVVINDLKYESENVTFKIPQQLKVET